MLKISPKAILTAVIGTSIIGSLTTLPVRAKENNIPNYYQPSLAQIDGYTYQPDYNQSRDNFNRIIGVGGLAVGAGYIAWQLKRSGGTKLAHFPTFDHNNTSSLLDRVSPKLRQQLLKLTHSQQTADRLLSGTSISHPDRSPNWLAEKVIYDLERDRRA